MLRLVYKSVVLLALAASCFVLATAQKKSQREDRGLKGPVKTIQIELASSENKSKRVIRTVEEFDVNGSIVRQLMNDNNGVREWEYRWKHTYDGQGRTIRTEYLNDKGQLTNTGITTYNDAELRSNTTQINPNGTVNHIWASYYDKAGNLLRDTRQYPNGAGYEHIYNYDKANNRVEAINREIGGKLIDRSTWTYDDHGLRTSWTVEKADGAVLLMYKNDLIYDREGNIVERREYDRNGNLRVTESYSYEFDAQGNWTKRTTIRQNRIDGPPTEETIYRQLTYF